MLFKYCVVGYIIGIVDLIQGEMGMCGIIEMWYVEVVEFFWILGLEVCVNLKMCDGFFIYFEENLLLVVE